MPDNLRSSVIRLAHANPELRPHLLPLLGVRTADDKSFDEAVKDREFTNPATGNKVQFGSLPAEEQKKVRESWSKKNEGEGGKSNKPKIPYSKARVKAESHSESADKHDDDTEFEKEEAQYNAKNSRDYGTGEKRDHYKKHREMREEAKEKHMRAHDSHNEAADAAESEGQTDVARRHRNMAVHHKDQHEKHVRDE